MFLSFCRWCEATVLQRVNKYVRRIRATGNNDRCIEVLHITIMTLPRRGVIASIAAHPSFRPHALSLDMCYHLREIFHASRGCDWIACDVALRVLATQWNSGVLKSRPCACGHITQSVQHVVVDCMIHKAPDDFAGLCCPDAATRSWLEDLYIEGLANDYI